MLAHGHVKKNCKNCKANQNFESDLSFCYLFSVLVDTVDIVEGVCNGFLPYTRFLGFLEFSGYHQWQQESQ